MRNTEEWVALPQYPDYYVSNIGKIKKITNNKNGNGFKELVLKPRKINGYLAFTLINSNGVKKTVYIHQAIAICFILKPKIKAKLIVVHKDGNKINNVVENLAWETFANFMQNQFDTARRTNKGLWAKRVKKYGPKGSKKTHKRKSTISSERVEKIHALYQSKGYTLKKLAEQYNCSPSHIFNLLRNYRNSIADNSDLGNNTELANGE